MLRITQSESTMAAKNYFSGSLKRGDYYVQGQEIPGVWGGAGARLLGLEGPVTPEAFSGLLENKRPDGSQLTAKNLRNRRPGYDFTFDVPKSVSILHALNKDNRIVAAMREAAIETMAEIEQEMQTRVRKDGADEDRFTRNMIWADFVHFTSRPSDLDPEQSKRLIAELPWLKKHVGKDGRLGIPDPHLHMHVFAMNATYDEVEKQWKAGQFGQLKRDATYYQAAYHVRLAACLQKLGYDIEPQLKSFEVAGVHRPLIEAFSRRTRLIEETAKALGIVDPDAKAELGATTRNKKDTSLDQGHLLKAWRAMAGRAESDRLSGLLRNAAMSARGIAIDDPTAASKSIGHAVGHEFERSSEVGEKRLLATALERGVGRVSVAGVRKARLMTPGLIEATEGNENRLTTLEILKEEADLVSFVKSGKQSSRPIVPGTYQFTNPLFRNEPEKSAEQRAAIQNVLQSNDWIVGVIGRAGTGKTTMLKEVAAAATGARKRLIICAPTAEASRGVLRDEGFATANTVKALLQDPAMHEKLHASILWIDEAGMIGNRDMLALLRLAKEKGVMRVVLAGDPTQIRSVPRGDALKYLETAAGLSVSKLEVIQRQKTPMLKEAVSAISQGDVAKGFDLLKKTKGIVTSDSDSMHQRLAEDYVRVVGSPQKKSVLVVSPTHREGEAATDAIRSTLHAKGLLSGNERLFDRTVNLSLTDSEKSNPAAYLEGMVIQFKQNTRDFTRSQRALVTRVDTRSRKVTVLRGDKTEVTLPLNEPQKFNVYRREKIALAVGDRVRISENGYDDSRKIRLNNGALYSVSGFTPEGDIRLSNGAVITKHFGNLSYGYVVTADAAQSKTVDVVLAAIGQESIMATDMRRTYVTVSRAREAVRIYTDDPEALHKAASRDSFRRSGTELVGAERAQKLLEHVRRVEAAKRRTAPTVPQKRPEPTRRAPKAPGMEMER